MMILTRGQRQNREHVSMSAPTFHCLSLTFHCVFNTSLIAHDAGAEQGRALCGELGRRGWRNGGRGCPVGGRVQQQYELGDCLCSKKLKISQTFSNHYHSRTRTSGAHQDVIFIVSSSACIRFSLPCDGGLTITLTDVVDWRSRR